MDEKHHKIIEDVVKDLFAFRDKFFDFEVNSNLQFLLAQLDLFKTISTIIIALVGIGYLYNQRLDLQFLFVSLCLATIVFIFSLSYTREVIDNQSYQNKKIREYIYNKTEIAINKAIESIKKDDVDIYFKFTKEQLKIKYINPFLNYAGEIVVFALYSSVGFLFLSYFGILYSFGFLSYQTIILLVVVYFLSFKNWAVKVSEILSKRLL